MIVVPVIAAVTAAVLICAPPEFFGTRKSTAPLPRSIVREPRSKLKIVFAPSRAIVRSVKVNSPRESTPVRTAVPPRTSSFTAAGFGSACSGSNLTSLMTAVTRAAFSSAPDDCPMNPSATAATPIVRNTPVIVMRAETVAKEFLERRWFFCDGAWPGHATGKPRGRSVSAIPPRHHHIGRSRNYRPAAVAGREWHKAPSHPEQLAGCLPDSARRWLAR